MIFGYSLWIRFKPLSNVSGCTSRMNDVATCKKYQLHSIFISFEAALAGHFDEKLKLIKKSNKKRTKILDGILNCSKCAMSPCDYKAFECHLKRGCSTNHETKFQLIDAHVCFLCAIFSCQCNTVIPMKAVTIFMAVRRYYMFALCWYYVLCIR